ncbi:MAG: regulatory protein RecX [Gammaproteobacteria bacterium]
MLRKLLSRGFAAGVAGEIVSGLVAERLLDNARFAESFVHSRYQRGQGPLKIKAGLHERGIDAGLVDRALDDSDPQWRELAARVRSKRFGPVLPADFRERSRQMRFLQQRGFSAEQIAAVFRELE